MPGRTTTVAPRTPQGTEFHPGGLLGRTSVDITLTLPATLPGPGGATIPLSFAGANAAACELSVLGVCQAAPQPPGHYEGLFELAAPELPAVTLPLLVSPRGAFLVRVHALLSALGVPHRILRDSAQLRVSRPGSGTEIDLSWTSADSASLVATSSEVWVAAPRLAALIDGTLDVDLATLTEHVSREGGFPAQTHMVGWAIRGWRAGCSRT